MKCFDCMRVSLKYRLLTRNFGSKALLMLQKLIMKTENCSITLSLSVCLPPLASSRGSPHIWDKTKSHLSRELIQWCPLIHSTLDRMSCPSTISALNYYTKSWRHPKRRKNLEIKSLHAIMRYTRARECVCIWFDMCGERVIQCGRRFGHSHRQIK